jgi:hypothetical protein
MCLRHRSEGRTIGKHFITYANIQGLNFRTLYGLSSRIPPISKYKETKNQEKKKEIKGNNQRKDRQKKERRK